MKKFIYAIMMMLVLTSCHSEKIKPKDKFENKKSIMNEETSNKSEDEIANEYREKIALKISDQWSKHFKDINKIQKEIELQADNFNDQKEVDGKILQNDLDEFIKSNDEFKSVLNKVEPLKEMDDQQKHSLQTIKTSFIEFLDKSKEAREIQVNSLINPDDNINENIKKANDLLKKGNTLLNKAIDDLEKLNKEMGLKRQDDISSDNKQENKFIEREI